VQLELSAETEMEPAWHLSHDPKSTKLPAGQGAEQARALLLSSSTTFVWEEQVLAVSTQVANVPKSSQVFPADEVMTLESQPELLTHGGTWFELRQWFAL
jgi:hypothetical protein